MEIGSKPFIIAELSGNHGGSLERAKELIIAASNSGVDAIKIQTYEPYDLNDPTNKALYEKSKIPREWFPELFGLAEKCRTPLFSSVFSPWAIEFLEQFNCPAYKIASPESTRLPLLTYLELERDIKRTGKMFLASTGRKDVKTIKGLNPDVLFYCVAGYPAKINDSDLEFMDTLDDEAITGFSDHTADLISPIAMMQVGAHVIEKHFKISNDCIDAAFSLNPQQMKKLCEIAHQ